MVVFHGHPTQSQDARKLAGELNTLVCVKREVFTPYRSQVETLITSLTDLAPEAVLGWLVDDKPATHHCEVCLKRPTSLALHRTSHRSSVKHCDNFKEE